MNKDESETQKSQSILAKIGEFLSPKKEPEGGPAPGPERQASDQAPARTAATGQPAPAEPQPPAVAEAGSTPAATDEQPPPRKPSRSGRRGPRKRGPRKKPAARQQEATVEEVVSTDLDTDDEIETIKTAAPPKKGVKVKLLINSDGPEECRIALLENGKLESFHVETLVRAQNKGNIYKGIITAVEPNLQAAFVDIGTGKNGFLPFGDIHPEYYSEEVAPDTHWKKLNIEKMIKKGQEVLVEVVKEVTGSKGASLTTYLSLPGRYIVLMPGSDSAGISRKIEDEEQRARLRSLIESFKRPEGIGYIVRTASKDITKTALSQDIKYLLNLWEEIKANGQTAKAPALIYKEQNVISRFLRDHFTQDIQEILVDDRDAYEQVRRFLDLLPAGHGKAVAKFYQESRPLFSCHEAEKQIEQVYQPTVQLPSGGSIVINPTEALVAIDVNSGRTAKDKNFEETIFLANMEAAAELARQLRLRDLGGLIVVDFIDMRDKRHIREVEKEVKNSMKRDKAKVDISRISKFGLLQISRQKMAAPIQAGSYTPCEHCQGRGVIRSVETLALSYMRRIQAGIIRGNIQRVECRLPLTVAQYLLNKKRSELAELERRYTVTVAINPDPAMNPQDEEIRFIKQDATAPNTTP